MIFYIKNVVFATRLKTDSLIYSNFGFQIIVIVANFCFVLAVASLSQLI